MAESYSVQAILSAVDKNFSSTMKSAQSSADTFADRVKSVVTGIGVTKLLGKATSVLSSSLDGAINRYDTLNSYPKVMSSLGFTTEDAQKSVAKLNESVQGLPTSLADIVSSAQSLTSVTGNMDTATDTAIALNHALLSSSASTEDVSRAQKQYSQMLAKGTVDLESWRTLQETMSPALTKVAKKLGITSGSATELYDALKNGSITFDEFNAAMVECDTEVGGFADTASEASKGIKTSLTNIGSAVQNLELGFMSAFDNLLKSNSLSGVVDFLEGIKSKIYELRSLFVESNDGGLTFNFKPDVLEALNDVLQRITSTASNLANHLKDAWESFKNTNAIETAKNAIEKVADAIDKVINATANCGILEDLANAFGQIVTQVSLVVEKIADFISSLDENTLSNFMGTLKQLFKVYLGDKVISTAANKITDFGKKAQNTVSSVKSLCDNVKSLYEQFKEGKSVSDIFGKKEDTSTDTNLDVGRTVGTEQIKAKFQGIAQVVESVGNSIKTALQGIGDIFESVGSGIKEAAQGIGNGIKSAFQGVAEVLESAGTAIQSILQGIGSVIESLGTAVASVAKGIGEGLASAFIGLGTAIAMVGPATWLALSVAILAVGAAIALVASQGEGMKAILEGVAVVIQALTPVIQTVVDGIAACVQQLPAIFESMGEAVKSSLEGVATCMESMGTAMSDVVTAISDGISNIVSSIGDALSGVLDSLSGVIESIGNAALNAGTGFKQMANGIKKITDLPLLDMGASLAAVATGVAAISTAAIGLGDTGTQIMTLATGLQTIVSIGTQLSIVSASIPGLISAFSELGTMTGTITSVASAMSAFSASVVVSASSIASASANMLILVSAVTAMSAAFNSASSTVQMAMNQMINSMKQTESQTQASGTAIGNNVKNGVKSGLSALPSICNSSINSMFATLNSASSKAYTSGLMIGQGLANGLRASASAVQSAAASLASAADAAIQAKAKIGSPSKVQYQNGIWFGQGLVNGIKAMEGKVYNVAYDMMSLPMIAQEKLAFNGFSSNLDSNYDYNQSFDYTINVPLSIDGKEFANATVDYTMQAQAKKESFNKRLRGVK